MAQPPSFGGLPPQRRPTNLDLTSACDFNFLGPKRSETEAVEP